MDLRPLLRPKHILLTLLVGLLTGATLAAASLDTDPDVPAALSAPVAVPAPREGDQGVYDLWDGYGRRGPESGWGEPDSTFRFRWLADELRLDGAGNRAWANVLSFNHTYVDGDGDPVSAQWTYALRAGTMQPMAHVQRGSHASFSTGDGLTPVSSRSTQGVQGVTWFDESGLWVGYPCLRLPMQGGLLELGDQPIDLDGCAWFDHGEQSPPAFVESVGGELDRRDVVLVSTTNDLGFPNVRTRIWLREGVPYPIRYEERGGMGDLQQVAVLREFGAGDQPLRGVTPTVDVLPGLARAPVTRFGPDASGVDVPFSLEEAFNAAASNANRSILADFLAAHPDAYVGWAESVAYDLPDETRFNWRFGVTDGHDVHSVAVTRHWWKDPSVAGLPLGLGPARPNPSDRFDEAGSGRYADYVPLPPDQLPATLPTVQGLFQWWAAYASPDMAQRGANTWAFQLGVDLDGEGGAPGVFVDAGHLSLTMATPFEGVLPDVSNVGTSVARTDTWAVSELHLRDGLDRVLLLAEGTTEWRSGEVPSTLPMDPEPGAQAFGPPTEASAIRARGLFELTPLERATVGLGALGAALAVYLSPLLKSALSGLFSRIRGDELLEHPARRLAHDLVAERPGIHHQELVRRLGKGKGGAEHHLRKLVDGGLLVRRAGPRYTCYFLPSQASRAAVAAAPVLKSAVAQRIVEMRRVEPAVTNAEMARRLGVRPATVFYHVERLRAAGLLLDVGAVPDGVQAA